MKCKSREKTIDKTIIKQSENDIVSSSLIINLLSIKKKKRTESISPSVSVLNKSTSVSFYKSRENFSKENKKTMNKLIVTKKNKNYLSSTLRFPNKRNRNYMFKNYSKEIDKSKKLNNNGRSYNQSSDSLIGSNKIYNDLDKIQE